MMRASRILCLFSVAVLLCSCAITPEPSKRSEGNLELSIEPLREGDVVLSPSIFLDDHFIGTVSARKPILQMKRGRHTVRLELPGYQTWEREIYILGKGNMHYLHVRLEKVGDQ